jgi:hypothetical protein
MPERNLEVVIARDGVDTVIQAFPLAEKDTVRLHTPDDNTFRAVIRHPRDAYDKLEREVRPGEFEVLRGDDAVEAAAEAEKASEAEAKAEAKAEKSTAKKTTAKKSAAKK